MRRREFIILLGAAASASMARSTYAQIMPVIGFLSPGSMAQRDVNDAVRNGIRNAGFIEGRNVTIEYRFAEGRFEQLPELAADLARRQVSVIIALGVAASVAARDATTTVPIVFYMGEDPITLGLVPTLNRPGGNLTGVATLSSAVMAKRLELLNELAPRAQNFAALINPKNPYAAFSAREAQDAARALGKDIRIVHASTEDEIDQAFAQLAQMKAGALLIAPDGLFITRAAQVAALAERYAIPASHERRQFPDAGGLMSYGASQLEGMRLAGSFVGRVLKGEKPADMPVMQPTKLELVINLKAASALGLTAPATLLVAADEVIE